MESTNEKTLFEVAEINLSDKSKVKPSLLPKIECPKNAEKVLRQIWNSDKLEFVEEFKILLTNKANKVLGEYSTYHMGRLLEPSQIQK